MTDKPAELPPLSILLNQLDWNLQWLQQMEKNEPTDYYRDAALQRFEFTFNTAMKCIRAHAQVQNIDCATPKECFELAEQMEWLPRETPWQDMVEDFEKIKPESSTKDPDAVFANLKVYREYLKQLFDRLKESNLDS